jgi:hypothetical protein
LHAKGARVATAWSWLLIEVEVRKNEEKNKKKKKNPFRQRRSCCIASPPTVERVKTRICDECYLGIAAIRASDVLAVYFVGHMMILLLR